MAYKSNIPQPNDRIKVSQSDILENFSQISTVFSVDHETFDAPRGQGKHKQVTFPAQAIGAPAAGEIRLYSNTSTFTGNPELFIRNGSTGTNFEVTSAKKAAQGWTMTPAGLLIKWGNATIASASGGPFNFIWPAGATEIAFSAQYWAMVIVGADPGSVNKDVNAVAYVTSVSNPLQVTYRIWRRNLFNTQGTDRQPFSVWVVAFGSP